MTRINPLEKLFAGFHREQIKRQAEIARADPVKHKLTRVIGDGKPLNYRYYGPVKTRGRRVTYCVAVHRNVAGYFLAWRETSTKKEVRRDQWIASKRKATVAERSRARWIAHKKRINASKEKAA